MLAHQPEAGLPLPPSLIPVVRGRAVRPVWRNQLGGLTFEVGEGDERSFVKWSPAGSGLDLDREASKLTWAADRTPVPHVLARGADATGSWLLTAALAGESAVSERWKAEPARAVEAIGRGLRAFHDALPVAVCPFVWSAEERLADRRRRAGQGFLDPSHWHPEHRMLTIGAALALLAEVPAPDRLVVCHGDACAPNTLIGQDGRWSGHVDLGSMGVGDRWADLAVATWSTEWNYGPGWEEALLEAYGVLPDPQRTAYYRLLWDVA